MSRRQDQPTEGPGLGQSLAPHLSHPHQEPRGHGATRPNVVSSKALLSRAPSTSPK